MPNFNHIPICPYYQSEKKKSISCEDTFRRFDSTSRRNAWLTMYCDSWDWMRCPYAADLSEAYERYEKGDEMAIENHEIEALRKELKSVTTKLGRAEKRTERQQKKIDELRSVNQSLTNAKIALDKKSRHFQMRYNEAAEHNKEFEQKIFDQVQKISRMYEQRICYLIEEFVPDKRFTESDVSEWAEDKAFALVYERDEDEMYEPYWAVKYGEETEENADNDNNIQADVQEGQEVRQ